jgi:hypothetical protein
MILIPSARSSYPKVAQYVQTQLPFLISVPLIMEGLRRYGAVDAQSAYPALGPSGLPRLDVRDLGYHQKGDLYRWTYGRYNPKEEPDTILLAAVLASEFERGQQHEVRIKGGRQAIPGVGAVILHELTHWGDWQLPRGTKSLVKEGAQEPGYAFQIHVFGEEPHFKLPAPEALRRGTGAAGGHDRGGASQQPTTPFRPPPPRRY